MGSAIERGPANGSGVGSGFGQLMDPRSDLSLRTRLP